jgi:Spy/CpxP family protein refolding chaperone
MKLTLSTFLLCFAALTAFAQDNHQPAPDDPGHSRPQVRRMRSGPPPFDWWRNSEVAQKLNLSDQQKQQLEEIFTQARLQLVDLKGAVEKEEIKLQSLMNADPINEPQVVAQIDSAQAARGKLEKNFALMALQFRKVLSAEQWKQLQQQDFIRFHKRREGGPGAPGAPGGPPPGDN